MDKNDNLSSSFSSNEKENLISDGKNHYSIVCVRCSSKILNAGAAEFKEVEVRI